MNLMSRKDFTLPGEAGYEQLTLDLAEKWGADVIRDSDGTKLSPSITSAGYRIYSTLCIIREHNAFAKAHPETQQQCFLSSDPVLATSDTLSIDPLNGYFREQFSLNDSEEALPYWQVWDRTENRLIPGDQWSVEGGIVTIRNCVLWHRYTVSFLVWRIWEEINMYNHTTNQWTSEHLRQLDPRHPLAWEYLTGWLQKWCRANPRTSVVRLTSLFYNFVWIFGDDLRRRTRFTDWSSYDFTVSPAALKAFEEEYGFSLTAEDFIQKGWLQSGHRPPTQFKQMYMDFTQRFVAAKARELVHIIHQNRKRAYVFYDDSWVGMEPNGPYFSSIGFDGLIKCVFSGFECRLCAAAKVPVHELRLHPYLFPVGLGGLPTFSEGGHPEKDAMDYWLHVRRALARQCVDRIGLGGYLHLTEGFPAFVDTIATIADEFRALKALHAHGAPATLPIRVGVLHTWGRLRSWTLSGHFHETDGHVLIHLNEALAGLPVEVSFLSFEDVKSGALENIDVVINAGQAGDAWSGGDAWKDPALVTEVTRYVYEGGCLIGVQEPSAVSGMDTHLALAPILGVDVDDGRYACHMPWSFSVEAPNFPIVEDALTPLFTSRLIAPDVQVFESEGDSLQFTMRSFGRGKAAYLSGFIYSPAAARMLLDLLMDMTGVDPSSVALSNMAEVEAAWFPADQTLVILNDRNAAVETEIAYPNGVIRMTLNPLETLIRKV